ncbi:MAG: hypothetical protein J0H66_05060 [Solirubrobacterales bacterium]|nr:hypothetical protein [Solirubrobacterales bacterium]OJU95229.1 MAG: hypothetical protein BGO23_05025 [Solirubrobacterales bacterium 67-14]
MSWRRLDTPLAWLALTGLAALAIVTVADGRGSGSGSVTFCAAGNAGKLTVAKNGKCGHGKRKIRIAKQGPRGKAGKPGPAGATGVAGADASAATLAPEPVHFVRPAGASGACASDLGSFCAYEAQKFDNVGGAYAKVGYRKDSSGFVHLQGLTDWACNNGCAGESLGETIFYLPTAYAPTDGTREFPIGICVDDMDNQYGGTRTVRITADGAVTLSSSGCGPDSLDGISFHP